MHVRLVRLLAAAAAFGAVACSDSPTTPAASGPSARLTISPSRDTLYTGETLRLTVSRTEAGRRRRLPPDSVHWFSSSGRTAVVDSLGVVHAFGVGPVIVTAVARKSPLVGGVPVDVDSARIDMSIRLTQISASMSRNCGIDAAGTGHCWDAVPASSPVFEPFPQLRLTRIESTLFRVCALTTTGAIVCAKLGATGMTTSVMSSAPAFRELAVGFDHLCALTEAGAAYCLGSDRWGTLGDGGLTPCDLGDVCYASAPSRVAGDLTFRAISAGYDHSCGLAADGGAFCWGTNNYGQLGTVVGNCSSYSTDSHALSCASAPVPVQGAPRLTALTSGDRHNCGLTADGVAYCWGDNGEGQLGHADGLDDDYCARGAVNRCSRHAVPVSTSLRFTAISAKGDETCALTAAGALYCWGLYHGPNPGADSEWCADQYQRLPCVRRPALVRGAGSAVAIAAGDYSPCLLSADGSVFCQLYDYERPWDTALSRRPGSARGTTTRP